GVIGQTERWQRAHAVTGVEEQRGHLLRVGGAAAVAEREQPPAGREPAGHVLGAGPQPGRVAGADLAPQRGDLGGLGHGGPPGLPPPPAPVAPARVEERVERLHRGGAGVAGGAAGPARRGHDGTTAIASPACTRMVSPGAASTNATLTSSSPEPVSTRARSSPSSRTMVTGTALSEQV